MTNLYYITIVNLMMILMKTIDIVLEEYMSTVIDLCDVTSYT